MISIARFHLPGQRGQNVACVFHTSQGSYRPSISAPKSEWSSKPLSVPIQREHRCIAKSVTDILSSLSQPGACGRASAARRDCTYRPSKDEWPESANLDEECVVRLVCYRAAQLVGCRRGPDDSHYRWLCRSGGRDHTTSDEHHVAEMSMEDIGS